HRPDEPLRRILMNPTFRHGPITFAVAEAVDKFHVVALSGDGIAPCGATDVPFGAVSESGAPAAARADNDLTHGLPDAVAVHYTGAVLPLAVASAAGDIAAGTAVYTAASGEVTDDDTNKQVGV